jgi:hypothetical protein
MPVPLESTSSSLKARLILFIRVVKGILHGAFAASRPPRQDAGRGESSIRVRPNRSQDDRRHVLRDQTLALLCTTLR